MCHGLIATMRGTLLGMSSQRPAPTQQPQSALNLRLALTLFGLAFTVLLVVLAIYYRNLALGAFAMILGAITIIDLVVIQVRRKQRREREPGVKHSIFE